MFVAASTRCFADLSVPDACRQLGDLEYTKYEIWLGGESPGTSPEAVAENVEDFTGELREATRLTPVAISIDHDVDATTFEGIAALAKTLRVAQLTIPASPLGTPFNTEVDRLREFVRLGAASGLRVSIKTRTGDLSEDPHTAVELCQSVKGLGITLDPSYYVCGPNQSRSYDQVFPHVYHMQLRDTKPDALQVPAGLGEIDYSRVVSHLRHEHYGGALSVELLPEQMDDAQRPLEMRKLRMLLESLL